MSSQTDPVTRFCEIHNALEGKTRLVMSQQTIASLVIADALYELASELGKINNDLAPTLTDGIRRGLFGEDSYGGSTILDVGRSP